MIFILFLFYLALLQSQSCLCKNAQNEQHTLASSEKGKEKKGSRHSVIKAKWVGWCCFLFLLCQSLRLLALLPPIPDSIKSCCEYCHVYVPMDWPHNLKSPSVLPGLPWCQWRGPVTSNTTHGTVSPKHKSICTYLLSVFFCCLFVVMLSPTWLLSLWPDRNFTNYVREAFFYKVLIQDLKDWLYSQIWWFFIVFQIQTCLFDEKLKCSVPQVFLVSVVECL